VQRELDDAGGVAARAAQALRDGDAAVQARALARVEAEVRPQLAEEVLAPRRERGGVVVLLYESVWNFRQKWRLPLAALLALQKQYPK
jgi:hypothetical protein